MRFRLFVSTAAVLLLGTAAMAQKVTYDVDRSANFPAFKTYAWIPGTNLSDPLNHKRVVDDVNAQLVARRLTRVNAIDGPDLLVAYHATFDRTLQISGFASGWGPSRFGGGSATARTDRILTGTLVVDVIDARTRTIVWRGTAAKEVDTDANPDTRDRNITRAAERLFKNYPSVK